MTITRLSHNSMGNLQLDPAKKCQPNMHVNIKREPKHETETLSMSDVNLHGDVHKPKYNDNYVP